MKIESVKISLCAPAVPVYQMQVWYNVHDNSIGVLVTPVVSILTQAKIVETHEDLTIIPVIVQDGEFCPHERCLDDSPQDLSSLFSVSPDIPESDNIQGVFCGLIDILVGRFDLYKKRPKLDSYIPTTSRFEGTKLSHPLFENKGVGS